MSRAHQAGIGQDVLINLRPKGFSQDQKIVIPLAENLYFNNSLFQIVKGKVKLMSYSITGYCTMFMTYTTSGRDLLVEDVGVRPRLPRVTQQVAKTETAVFKGGSTLAERLQVMQETFDKKILGGGREKFSKLAAWPVSIVATRTGLIRSKWSNFACFACTDVDFFTALGYAPHQIYGYTYNERYVYSLAPEEFAEGEAVGVIVPDAMATSNDNHECYLIPSRSDIEIKCEVYVNHADMTVTSAKSILEAAINNANYKYRTAVLEQDWTDRLVWPKNAEYADGNLLALTPGNIFPLHASIDADDTLCLTINTAGGQGSVKKIWFAAGVENVFAFPDVIESWDEERGRNKRVEVRNIGVIGIRDQECEITSSDMFLARATIGAEGVGPALCASFLDDNPHRDYFPKNRLSPSTYNAITLIIKSRHSHPHFKITNEVYKYSLVCELRHAPSSYTSSNETSGFM